MTIDKMKLTTRNTFFGVFLFLCISANGQIKSVVQKRTLKRLQLQNPAVQQLFLIDLV